MFRSKDIIAVSGGKSVSGADMIFPSVSIDSRRIKKGALFIPIKGDNFDGHEFIGRALDGGAAGSLLEERYCGTPMADNLAKRGSALFCVESSLSVLQGLARLHRQRVNPKVVAVAGSNGKTTTKDMIWSIVSGSLNCLKSKGNFNNHIGLPLTLLNLREEHELVVVELGINMSGEMDLLCEIASPDIGVITNIGCSHLEGLGGMDGVIKEKGRILEHAAQMVLNADDEHSAGLSERSMKCFTFGMKNRADITGEIVGESLKITRGSESLLVSVPVLGIHNLYNALAAAAVSSVLGFELLDIKEGLHRFRPEAMRMELFRFESGLEVINDSYNANPPSMKASIDTLKTMPCRGRRIALLGDMLELGESAAELHRDIGVYLADSGIHKLLAFGSDAENVAQGALEAGMRGSDVFCFEEMEAMLCKVEKLLKPEDIVLIKGSRGMRMERVFAHIRSLWNETTFLNA